MFCFDEREDPKQGFQRLLDEKRARDIASYIDHGFGTIPNSIVLSAQPESELKVVGQGRSIEFKNIKKAFLVLDGQHRVYGFSMANSTLRVPVVIYSGLSRSEESRLFVDINTRQRPVPNELLLDIKNLAEIETNEEQLLRQIFDLFLSEPDSAFVGKLSPSKKHEGHLSRVTFNSAVKPLLNKFQDPKPGNIYSTLNAYFSSILTNGEALRIPQHIYNPIVFRALSALFVDVARQVKDRHGVDFSVANFSEVLEPMFSKIKRTWIEKPGNSYVELLQHFQTALQSSFLI